MAYDIVIKNGMVVDGSGGARYRGDVGVKDGKITKIGRINETADDVIDAEGHVVSPGFVDGHTHMDAQVFWDSLGTCSCYHGVTSVVMGNCGFTLAPCREAEADLVFRNLERAEDIDRGAMLEGIKWQWETYPEYLDVVDKLPKGINYSGYIGHSALRTYVMGERAFDEAASEDDLKAMSHQVKEAVKAGALGFSSSRSPSHRTSDDRQVASRAADFAEIKTLVHAMGELDAGIFQLAMERGDRDYVLQNYTDLKNLSIDSGRPITFGSLSRRESPGLWRDCYDIIEKGNLEGARLFTQVHSREINSVMSFETHLPFDNWDVWRDIRALPLDQQKAALRDPETKKKLIEIASSPYQGPAVIGGEARPPEWDMFYVMESEKWAHRTMADIARERGVVPAEAMIDMALEHDLKLFFRQPIANENMDDALDLMKHPHSCVTFSDSGAHVSQIMDSSLQTHLLSHWVRDKQAFTLEEAVRLVTYDTATQWGFHDRGLIREGMTADMVVFNPDTIGPRMPEVVCDLPAGAKRLRQTAHGIANTIVGGQTVLRNGEHTGALPGKLLRGPLAQE
ncbi:amidohydrolase family protein [Alphaproteobacteria bacterium]|nr:amidohydrolase family protein [Alphaproteobacteria bacterium]